MITFSNNHLQDFLLSEILKQDINGSKIYIIYIWK